MDKILVCQNSRVECVNYLRSLGYEVKYQSSKDENIVCNEIKDCVAFLAGDTYVGKKIMQSGENLKVISKPSVGVDLVDLEEAKQLGIRVTNAQGVNSDSTAEHTMALLLALSKNIVNMDFYTREGLWYREKYYSDKIKGKTLGLVGFGNIGSRVAKMAKFGFDMNIICYDNYAKDIPEYVTFVSSLEEVLTSSDYVSLHVPLTKETKYLINKDNIKLMKSSACIINCARGGVINENDLYDALYNNVIKAAALDTYEVEPCEKDNKLFTLNNVIVSPHNGAFSEQTIIDSWMQAAYGAVMVLENKECPFLVV